MANRSSPTPRSRTTVGWSPPAAAFYRQAQQAVDRPQAVMVLRLAVLADPVFGLAIADLDLITETPPSPIHGRLMTWERHHIEMVSTAAAGDLRPAADLLGEHLASVGCDPLALRIIDSLRQPLEEMTVSRIVESTPSLPSIALVVLPLTDLLT